MPPGWQGSPEEWCWVVQGSRVNLRKAMPDSCAPKRQLCPEGWVSLCSPAPSQSASTACSRACSERFSVLAAEHRNARKARLSKVLAVKKARRPMKAGGGMDRRTRALTAGIWLVRLSM